MLMCKTSGHPMPVSINAMVIFVFTWRRSQVTRDGAGKMASNGRGKDSGEWRVRQLPANVPATVATASRQTGLLGDTRLISIRIGPHQVSLHIFYDGWCKILSQALKVGNLSNAFEELWSFSVLLRYYPVSNLICKLNPGIIVLGYLRFMSTK